MDVRRIEFEFETIDELPATQPVLLIPQSASHARVLMSAALAQPGLDAAMNTAVAAWGRQATGLVVPGSRAACTCGAADRTPVSAHHA